jgi:ketosteroid isomerase-like protein
VDLVGRLSNPRAATKGFGVLTLVEPFENETLARRFMALASARDYTAVAELLDPDVVWYGTRGGIDAERIVRGPDAYLAYMREVLGTFERYEFEVEETFRFEGGVLVYLWEARLSSNERRTETARGTAHAPGLS